MLNDDLENLQRKINDMIISEGIDSDELLRLSRKLDMLIVRYMWGNREKTDKDMTCK
jgi:hypothetical protein